MLLKMRYPIGPMPVLSASQSYFRENTLFSPEQKYMTASEKLHVKPSDIEWTPKGLNICLSQLGLWCFWGGVNGGCCSRQIYQKGCQVLAEILGFLDIKGVPCILDDYQVSIIPQVPAFR
jgi:hypothetical protein